MLCLAFVEQVTLQQSGPTTKCPYNNVTLQQRDPTTKWLFNKMTLQQSDPSIGLTVTKHRVHVYKQVSIFHFWFW